MGELVVAALDGWEGTASIMILRGKPRKLYDVKFKVRDGAESLSLFGACGCTPQHLVMTPPVDPPALRPSTLCIKCCVPQVVVEFRMRGGESGAAPKVPDSPTVDGKPKPKTKKRLDNDVPKAMLVFHDVSNDCDGDFEVCVCAVLPWSACLRRRGLSAYLYPTDSRMDADECLFGHGCLPVCACLCLHALGTAGVSVGQPCCKG